MIRADSLSCCTLIHQNVINLKVMKKMLGGAIAGLRQSVTGIPKQSML
jgi:hypothetical protein